MKNYPMNGPTLEIQRLMESPRKNKVRLKQYFDAKQNMRPETADIIKLK